MTNKSLVFAAIAVALAGPLACGGSDAPDAAATKTATAKADDAPAVKPTGKIIEIKMISDTKGERYDPVEIKAQTGDMLRFVLTSGVHNVHFLPDSNPKTLKFPPMSQYLQMPGQKLDILVAWPEGRYYFQCDAHVMLGMIGYVNVENPNE